ncbi:MAG TPA: hypothetical protein VGG11_08230 [Xanthobacteraceae bacterium]|jgi:hypothetical protein
MAGGGDASAVMVFVATDGATGAALPGEDAAFATFIGIAAVLKACDGNGIEEAGGILETVDGADVLPSDGRSASIDPLGESASELVGVASVVEAVMSATLAGASEFGTLAVAVAGAAVGAGAVEAIWRNAGTLGGPT